MPDLQKVHPEVTWAQRSSTTDAERNYLYVSIKAPDVPHEAANLQISNDKVSFAGDSRKGVRYDVSLELYGEIDPQNSKVNHSDREVELILRKKELKQEFWPRLLKTTQKIHFLKTDFDKWVDEDEQDEAPEDDYANNFAGLDGPDQGGLGNIDFSKLGAMDPAAMGMDLAAMGDAGAEGEDDDDEMPELEDPDDKAEGEKSSKIQEIS